MFKSIFNTIKDIKLNNHIVFTNYVPNDILGALYKNAGVFILPSLYEGFGIPALEAMHLGTPVVVSNISSLPEVVGKAGKLINPNSENDIAEKIHEVLTNVSLKESMIKKGFKQARKFSWKQSTKIIMNEFNKLKY